MAEHADPSRLFPDLAKLDGQTIHVSLHTGTPPEPAPGWENAPTTVIKSWWTAPVGGTLVGWAVYDASEPVDVVVEDEDDTGV